LRSLNPSRIFLWTAFGIRALPRSLTTIGNIKLFKNDFFEVIRIIHPNSSCGNPVNKNLPRCKDAERESKTKNKDLWSEIVERLTEEGERKKNQDNILGDFAMDARRDRQQQAEQQRAEREAAILRDAENDTAPSSEYPGMTVGEVLRGLRIINENLPYYSQRAVDKGLIKPEERLAFEQYMREKYWLEQQRALQRRGEPNALDTPEGRARINAILNTEQRNPHMVRARNEAMDATRRDGMNATDEATITRGFTRRFSTAQDWNNGPCETVPAQNRTESREGGIKATHSASNHFNSVSGLTNDIASTENRLNHRGINTGNDAGLLRPANEGQLAQSIGFQIS
jgi:hypothetical protein